MPTPSIHLTPSRTKQRGITSMNRISLTCPRLMWATGSRNPLAPRNSLAKA